MTRGRAEIVRLFVSEHFDFVWRSVRRLGVPLADTDDATQEVLLVAVRRLDDIEPGRARAFLYATARGVASTYRRGKRRKPEQPSDALEEIAGTDLDPEQLSELSAARAVLDEILDEMSAELREVFVLCELEELAAPAVAALVDLPVGTVHSRLLRAREAFRGAVKRRLAKDGFPRRLR